MAGATTAPLPPTQDLFLCRTAACPLLHFGGLGAEIPVAAATQRPWFKDGGDVACFCFGHRVGGLTPETLVEVEARVRRRECACDLRNPSGKCCLADLGRLVTGRARRT